MLFSQVAINVDSSNPNNSAMLDIKSNNKGLLPPRMTHAEMNGISNPADGLIVFCTDCSQDGKGSLSIFLNGNWNSVNLNCYVPVAPTIKNIITTSSRIVWGWEKVPYATGYKWNILSDYSTATQMDTVITKTETGLTCNTEYKRYVWAFNTCGNSLPLILTGTTLTCSIPILSTTVASAISSTTATSGGSISADGDALITAKGVCWATTQNPTIANSKTIDGAGAATFSSSLTGLLPNTMYYVKAYATNGIGTAYGNQITLTTSIGTPILTTNAASSIGTTTATSGGTITTDGGAKITAKGVCWATTQNPTTANTKTNDGTGAVSFTSSLSGLLPGTTYYVKAYATNSLGTAYGNQVNLTTHPDAPVLTTTNPYDITTQTATSGGNITSDGGMAITARGVCWATTPNPTTSNYHTTDGTGSGTFTSNLTNLFSRTTYYLRAYATNFVATSYGNEVSFIPGTLTDIDGNLYSFVEIGTQTWMAENLKTTKYRNGEPIPNITINSSWMALVTGAYSWYNNDAATYLDTYGALYNWYAVVDSRNIAPAGWHVPTDAEWTTLTDYLDGELMAGLKLKESGNTNWAVALPKSDPTNSSRFTALPGGFRFYYNGTFNDLHFSGSWWCKTVYDTSKAYYRRLNYQDYKVLRNTTNKESGFSVRCVKD